MTNPYMSWFFNLTVTAAVFALPGLTAAGKVHCLLPVNSAFFTVYWTKWQVWIFSSTPLSASRSLLPPNLTFERS